MIELDDALRDLLQEHGLECIRHQSWFVPGGTLPAIRGLWYPEQGACAGQLDIQVLLPDNRLLLESFAGIGRTDSECQENALVAFIRSSFHVLLGALWGQERPVLAVESWVIAGQHWQIFIGQAVTRTFDGSAVELPDCLLAELQSAVQSASLPRQLHWLRLFRSCSDKIVTAESLMDNEHWQAGHDIMCREYWRDSDSLQSVRLFLVLKPVE